MATNVGIEEAASAGAGSRRASLQEQAKRHLWMHFTRMGAYADHEVPVIVRGEGCYVYDEHGKRYLDGLSALFCVNAGHGRAELAEAAARQARGARLLHQLELRAPARDRARRAHRGARARATSTASSSPRRLRGGRVGLEAGAQLPPAARRGQRTKLIARELAYHGTSLGRARRHRPDRRCARPFEPLTPGGCHVPNTNSYRWPADRDPLWAADAIEERILFEGPETVAAVILEPVQNAGGCFVPQDGYFQRVREICDRHGVLLISDEVICSWGRLGHYFGSRALRLPARHHHDRQGPHVGLRADGRGDRRPTGSPSRSWRATAMFAHGFTFGGHPVAAAVALANLDIFEREDLCGHVRAQRGRVPRDARGAARPADRRRRARRRLLPRDRAGEGPGDQGDLQRRGVRATCCAASCPASSTGAA